MIGGQVVETIILEDRVWINCANVLCKESTAIYVERNPDSEAIRRGDMLWWQGQYAMWTPQDGGFEDRKIPRIGFSGAARPLQTARFVDGDKFEVPEIKG